MLLPCDQKFNYELRVPKSEEIVLSLIPSRHPTLQTHALALPTIVWVLL